MGIRKPTRVPPVPKEPLRRPLSSDLDLRWQPVDIMRRNPEVSKAYDKLEMNQAQAIEMLNLQHGSPQTANAGVHIRTEPQEPVLYGKDKFKAEWFRSKYAFEELHPNRVFTPFDLAYQQHMKNKGIEVTAHSADPFADTSLEDLEFEHGEDLGHNFPESIEMQELSEPLLQLAAGARRSGALATGPHWVRKCAGS
jgi:hypothetical protein